MFETISAFWADYGNVLIEGTWETLIMVALSTALAYVIGVPLGVALIVTQPQGIRPHKGLYGVLGWIVNIGRSLPFAILLVAIMPYTRFLVGTAIGVRGAIPPLVISVRWMPASWKPPNLWAPLPFRSSERFICRRPCPPWSWAAPSPW